MPKKAHIQFVEVSQPITEPVTKFGGQPIWIDEPQWPVSKSTGQRMQFICQIQLDPEVFGEVEGDMAYIFMTDTENLDKNKPLPENWDAFSGENAVVIQKRNPDFIPQDMPKGPTLYIKKKKSITPCEYAVKLKHGDDPDYVDIMEIDDDQELDEYCRAVEGNKIGGVPGFIQGEEFPGGDKENWKLLLQLDSMNVPFYINFGDAGVGYIFLSNDGSEGAFLWQSC